MLVEGENPMPWSIATVLPRIHSFRARVTRPALAAFTGLPRAMRHRARSGTPRNAHSHTLAPKG